MKLRSILVLSSALGVLVVGVPTTSPAQQADGAAQPVPAPAVVQKQGDVSYVSGGVGDDAERAMKAVAKDFNLQITLAKPNGEYLAGTKLQIQNGSGKTVLEATSGGPFFYADLPPGEYTVRATAPQGEMKSEKVNLTKSGHATVLIHLSA